MRRLLFALFAPLLGLAACTSTQVTLAQEGDLCDDDQQCALPLICACVQTQGTDDEGNDQITAHGHCAPVGTKCLGDAAVDSSNDVGSTPTDTGAIVDTGNAGDTGSEAAADSGAPDAASTDASDAGADATTSDSATGDGSAGD